MVAFDFDGTLMTRDTFPAFIRFSLGFWRFAVGLAIFAPMLVAMKGGFLYDRMEAAALRIGRGEPGLDCRSKRSGAGNCIDFRG